MKNNDISSKIAVAIIAAALGAGAMYGGLYLSSPEMFKYSKQTKAIADCEKILAEKGDPDFDKKAAEDGMINGYLHEGGDKYTTYYDIASSGSETESMTSYVNTSGTAQASGFTVDKSEDGYILITNVVDGLAADKQGVAVNDEIIAIDDVSVSETGYENIANKLLGKQGTTVKLTILRNGEELTIDFVRDNETVRNATWEKHGKIGYIAISFFDDFTIPHVDEALADLGEVSSYVIDLRGCPGGKTDVCVEIASRFVESGEVTLHRFKGEEMVYKVESGKCERDVPVALLVNDKTASAAEIFTAIIRQECDKAQIIGTNTFGKGIFQEENIFDNGMRLRYTSGKFYVGKWDNWHGVGIAPDIEVNMDGSLIGTNDDLQLKKALDLLE